MTRMQLRCSPDQKERWMVAAGGDGNLSEWIRDVLDREAAAVEEGPDEATSDGTLPVKTPDEATSTDGPSSTDVIQVDPENNPDYVMGPRDEVPRQATPEEREMFGLPAVEEEPVGTNGDAEPDPPLPGEPDGSSSTVEDLDVIRTVGDAERALNDLIEVPPKTVMVEQRVPNPYPEGFTPTVEFEANVDFFKSSEPVAPTGGALTPSGERDVSSPGPDPGSDVSTDTHKAARFYNDPDDDTNPEPEDPVDLEPPRMLEADTPARATLSPVCVNAAMHWKLVAGETCRYCGGTL